MNPLRTTLLTFASLLAVIATSSTARAQFGSDRIQRPLNRPTVSPYVNLFRGNNTNSATTFLNYYGAVRPQQQFYSQDQRLSQRIDRNRRLFGSSQQSGDRGRNNPFRRYRMSITGHPTGFMTLGGPGGGQGDDSGQGGGDGEDFGGNSAFGGQAGGGGQSFGGSQSYGLGSSNNGSFGSGSRGFGQ